MRGPGEGQGYSWLTSYIPGLSVQVSDGIPQASLGEEWDTGAGIINSSVSTSGVLVEVSTCLSLDLRGEIYDGANKRVQCQVGD